MTDTQNPDTTTAPVRARSRGWLIAGGAVLAAAVLTGGGVAIGAAIDDDDDDAGESLVAETRAAGTELFGAASAADVQAVVAAAAGVADGEPVSIDADRDGSWDVELRAASGDETTVRVDAGGAASVAETDPAEADDKVPAGTLDDATIEQLVTAALAAADGRVVDLDVDSDPASPYDVTVLTSARTTVELSLDADLGVVRTETDD